MRNITESALTENENAHTRTGSGSTRRRPRNLGLPLLDEHTPYNSAWGLRPGSLGAIMAIGGAMMKTVSVGATKGAGQFSCAKCGAKFGSEVAVTQHTKDKHGM